MTYFTCIAAQMLAPLYKTQLPAHAPVLLWSLISSEEFAL